MLFFFFLLSDHSIFSNLSITYHITSIITMVIDRK